MKDPSRANQELLAEISALKKRVQELEQSEVERNGAERRQYLAAEILGIINDPSTLIDSINLILAAIKRTTGFDAVGIRLRSGDDFPYFVQSGFSQDFLLTENTLIARDASGGPCKDENGNISLECTCGLVISGQTDPTNPLFTEAGSSWTNNSLPFLDLPSEQDPRLHPRNNCIHQGYLSVALIPIRANREIVGLLQLNDRSKDCFTLDMIHFFERIGASIGIALMRKQAEEALRENELHLHMIVEHVNDAFYIHDFKGNITDLNDNACGMLGYTKEELLAGGLPLIDTPVNSELMPERMSHLIRDGFVLFEGQHKRKDGNVVEVNVSGRIVSRDGNGVVQSFVSDITERKRMEEALQASEEAAHAILNASKASIVLLDRAGIVLDNNKTHALRLQTTREAMIGKCIWDCFPAELSERRRGLVETVFETGQSVHVEDERAGKWNDFVIEPIFDRQGNMDRVAVYIQDITDRKQAEEELLKSESRFRTLSRVAPVGVYLTDEQGRCRYVNDRWMEMAGITFEEALGDGWIKGIHPQDRDLIASSWHKMIESKGNWGLEYRFQTRDGIVTWVKGLATDFSDSTGQVMGYIGTNMDITDRKKDEDALRESELKYRSLIESSSDAIFCVDDKGQYKFTNHLFASTLGKTPDYFIGKTFWDVYPKEHADHRYEATKRVFQTGESESLEVEVPLPNETLYFYATANPIKDATGKVILNLTHAANITKLKRIEEEKRSLESRLQRSEKMEALGTLAGGVAHDLNNVLGIVVGYAEMLLDEIDASSPLREDVLKIMEGGNRSAAIVQDLLTLARRGVQTQTVVNLNTVIMDCQKAPEFKKALSFNPNVRITINLEADLLNIKGSPVHLTKTIMNLVSNAVEAMPYGGILTITTNNQSLEKPVQGYDNVNDGDYVVLTITDTGEGISDHDIKRIFEPFYTKKVMGKSGTGLGLAVVWGTVKDHNGYIDVQSEVGKGTTFTLYFPVTREEITQKETTIPLSEYIGNDESILVIDDIKEQRELAAKMLGKLNYRVKTVASGEEAVEYLRTEKADLLVLDMIMDPGMDGLDTYKAVLEIHSKQKAIIVSGFSETERVKEAKSLGAGDYLRKPYVQEKLGLAVRKELARKIVTDPLSRTAICL